jgi:hypothetical protein
MVTSSALRLLGINPGSDEDIEIFVNFILTQKIDLVEILAAFNSDL